MTDGNAEDITDSKTEPKKYTKHVYLKSLLQMNKSSLMELYEESEVDVAKKTLGQLKRIESTRYVKKFSVDGSGNRDGHIRKSYSVSSGRIMRAKSIKPYYGFVQAVKGPIKTFEVKVNNKGQREIAARVVNKKEESYDAEHVDTRDDSYDKY